MMLFSKNGAEPSELPFLDADEEGNAWTNLAGNEEGRSACGWVEVATPAFDPETQRLAWIEGAWSVQDFPAEELDAALEQLRAARLADLAGIRWQRQQTFLYGGTSAPADDVTIGRVASNVLLAQLQGASSTSVIARWKFASGPLTPVTLAEMISYGTAIGAHLQACFDREAALAAPLLDPDATKAAIAGVDLATGWPE